MNTQMNLETFISMFNTETDAIDYILLAHDDGRVETIEYTIPFYTLISQSKPQTDTGNEYDRLAQPPRFIVYSNHAPQTHSYEVRITDAEHGELLIEFPRTCYKSSTWFNKHLINHLCDAWGVIERQEVNITDDYDLERTALNIQREINFRRMHRIQRETSSIDNYVTIEQFEQNCRAVVEMLDENNAISERILYIDSLERLSKLA